MPHFIAKKPQYTAELDSTSHYAYKLYSVKSSHLALIAMPYTYQNHLRMCFIYEITRENSVLLKGVKSLRPIPIGILKASLRRLSGHYEILQENLASTTLKQQIDSPFLLSEREILAIVESACTTSHRRVCLEVGFGSGRHIVHIAKERKDDLVIGLEVHTPSIEQVLRQIEILGLNNLYVSHLDARQFLQAIASKSINEIFIHFPVPWNNAKNRRVLNARFLAEALRVLRDGGALEFRTDDREYFDDVLGEVQRNPFANAYYTTNTKHAITSKYEARWLAQKKDIFTITITPDTTIPQVDSTYSGQKCIFGFDEKLVKSVLAKISRRDVLQPSDRMGKELLAYLLSKRCFDQGFLHIYDMYISAAYDRVAFLVYFGDFQYPCTRLIVFELYGDGYRGSYFPELPIANFTNAQAHELFIKVLESL